MLFSNLTLWLIIITRISSQKNQVSKTSTMKSWIVKAKTSEKDWVMSNVEEFA